ncbi:MAG TPA: 2-amino-4-hydroxy-6-hydroxymethyldihydropteridine diphosphokinase [Noviherbaspirillum sp.]|jgi:2-amino-4-hydroxy-6-hydroxymethyldihydropteridine diphosphokinase|uniref:2-amino-4-hydroxy-6- hydroxymethyldihydropteridine diphosphokinase n=1 Tax=Noviherbaspirillum sp. TaxID=1926288 RepID=UPI002DDCB19C|nr:2-amino-4-hydroxy-6-hydroxymethyldihydropteridine diphosphokinase [Noviherbaspirillum sp.]HEV2611097.1 2-amino-4-hydroxy-6-hydroxymethyldihydropteridine diphosphokinase [Noviherbaspirillum sp.]
MNKGRVDAYIGIGSNLGDAADHVQRAILRLGKLDDTRLTAQSNLFRTAPVDAGGDDYVNAVAKLETALPADRLLSALQAIEQDFGRERPFPNAPRTLDLDVLLYAQQRIDTPSLTVPHPRLTQRAFALIPLLQIDPMIAIPGKGPAHQFVPDVAGQAIQKI